MNASKARRVAIEILDEFEELLDRKGITIPSEDREGREEESRTNRLPTNLPPTRRNRNVGVIEFIK